MDLYRIKLPLDGRFLKALRAGRNQRTLEQDMSLPRGKLSQYERAICVAPIDHIKTIAKFYGVKPTEILSQGGRNAIQQLIKLYEHPNGSGKPEPLMEIHGHQEHSQSV